VDRLLVIEAKVEGETLVEPLLGFRGSGCNLPMVVAQVLEPDGGGFGSGRGLADEKD
jgi:hypothetical protein